MQKILAYTGASKKKKITEESVRLVTGAPAVDMVHDVILCIAERDLHRGLTAVKQASSQNIDMSVFQKLILHSARAVLLVRFGLAQSVKQDVSSTEFAFIEQVVKKTADTPELFSSTVLIELLSAYEQTQGAYISSLPLELALIRIVGEGDQQVKKV